MNYNFFQSHSSLRLLNAVLVMAALLFNIFCLTPGTAVAAHGDHMEESAEVMRLLEPVNQEECCHGLFHNNSNESIKTGSGNQQIVKQVVAVEFLNILNLTLTDTGNINGLGCLENYIKGASPPSSVLRC